MRLRASNDELTDQSSIISESDPPRTPSAPKVIEYIFPEIDFFELFCQEPDFKWALFVNRSIYSLKLPKAYKFLAFSPENLGFYCKNFQKFEKFRTYWKIEIVIRQFWSKMYIYYGKFQRKMQKIQNFGIWRIILPYSYRKL